MKKMISSENLYLCKIRQVVISDSDYSSSLGTTYRFVFCKPDPYNKIYFYDVFTKTKYKVYGDLFCDYGQWQIECTEPIVTDKRWIPDSVLVEFLKEVNPKFFEVKKTKTKSLKKTTNKIIKFPYS